MAAETHGSALELATDPHRTVADGDRPAGRAARRPRGRRSSRSGCAPPWRARIRSRVARDGGLGRRPLPVRLRLDARAGPPRADVRAARARRRPDAERRHPRAATALRAHLPLLLALSANSPFWQGRDTGLASARTPLFQAFPRVGIPRALPLLRGLRRGRRRAGPLRRDPRADVPVVGRAPAAALRHASRCGSWTRRRACATRRRSSRSCSAWSRLEATRATSTPRSVDAPEVLEENRFLAARDGMEARLIDPALERRVPARVAARRAAGGVRARTPRRSAARPSSRACGR